MAKSLTMEERRVVLDRAVVRYMRKGWLLQAQTDTRAQLYQRGKRNPWNIVAIGILAAALSVPDKVLVIEVSETGKVRITK